MKVNERTLQIRLMQHYLYTLNHKVVVPNSTMLLWGEVDLLSVTKAGLVHEFEIKCSRSDYNRELGDNHKYNKASKHQRLQNPGTYANYNPSPIPNYFWFVTYDFEIEPPTYCGWILVTEYEHFPGQLRLQVKKKAPRLHTGKWDDEQVSRMARLLSFRLLKTYEKDTV